jgi:hypothetical protein
MFMEFREFLYLDARLVEEFLAQVEGGIYDEEQEKSSSGKSGGINAGLKASVVQAGGKRDTSNTEEVARTRRQTPESRYNRLHEYLEESESLNTVDDGSQYGDIKERTIVSVDCYVDVPMISRAMDNAEELANFADVMSTIAPQEQNSEMTEALNAMTKIHALTGDSTVAIGEVGEGHLKFALKLKRAGLRVELANLEGEAIVVGKVEKKYPESQTYSLFNLPGSGMLNREMRRKMGAEVPSMKEHSLEGPAAVLSVIAIFR